MTAWMAIFGILTLLSAVGVVAFKNPLHSALSLIMTLLFVAVHYALLGADFLAAIQVMVYAGAIMVLVVFVIMLLGDADEDTVPQGKKESITLLSWLMALVSGITIFSILGYSILNSPFVYPSTLIPDGSASGLGAALYTQFLFPFEITSLLILSAIIGAVMLGAERKSELRPGRGLRASREKHSQGPGTKRRAGAVFRPASECEKKQEDLW